jgi:Protein of unknown function (DUF3108)
VTDLRTPPRPTSLWAALLLSALAHAVTLGGGWLQLPQTRADPPPLLARLDPVAPMLSPPAVVAPAARPAAKRAATVAAAPAPLQTGAPAPWIPPAIEAIAQTEAEPDAIMAQPQAPAPEPEPVVLANAAPGMLMPEPAVIKTLPRRGRISYDLNYYLSNMPTLVGRTVQSWEASDNVYTLDSLSETVGLARLTRFGPRVYRSSGMVGEHGLQPQSFTSKVELRGKTEEADARFDWGNNAIQFGTAGEKKNAALPAGSQDLLSFMYQFSLAPPPRGRLQMALTNGSRFESYDIDVFDEESIETPLGTLRALPVKQVRRQGRESVEIWLAAEYRYLPVRIRIINRDGTPGGEQIATEISLGEK